MGGRHRTGALTAVYRMTEDGWTADRAFSEMKQYHFGADFLHPELKKFVYTYFSQLDKAPRLLVAAGTPGVK
jgi:protein tyrosine/serine phosphatase